jgi:O-antigen/teichoic acid export membrane protein
MTFNRHLINNLIFRGIYYSSIFVLNIFIARTFQAELGGWINYITNNFSLLLLLGSFSLEIAILYYGTSKKITQSKLATFALIWSLIVCVSFYFVINFFISYNDSIQSKGLIKFASLNYIAGIIITNFFFNLFIILEEFAIPNILLSILNLFLIISIPENIFGLNIFNKDTFIYFYYFSFLLQGLLLIMAYFIFQKKVYFQLINLKEFFLLFKYATTCFLGNLIFFLSYRIDYWFINFYRNNALELGNYIQASKMGQMLLMFAVILGSSIFPVTASGEDRDALLKKILKIIRNFVIL